MNLTLSTNTYESGGIFGTLESDDGSFSSVSLEHSFTDESGKIAPKIPEGEYPCVRGIHHLKNTKYPDIEPNEFVEIETFEITGIPDFMGKPVSGCVFHVANYDREVIGCVAPGKGMGNTSSGGKMICSSLKAFQELMLLQKGIDQFILKVRR